MNFDIDYKYFSLQNLIKDRMALSEFESDTEEITSKFLGEYSQYLDEKKIFRLVHKEDTTIYTY